MVNGLPDGWLSRDALIFGEGVRENGVISRGAQIDLPDLRTCGSGSLISMYQSWAAIVDSLGDNEALQIQWSVTSDSYDFIERFTAASEKEGGTKWTEHMRRVISEQASVMMERGLLRREKLHLFLGRRMNGVKRIRDPQALASYVEKESENLAARLTGWGSQITGGTVRVMDDAMHGHAWEEFLHPGRILDAAAREKEFSPELSLQEHCLHAPFMEPLESSECFFQHDGYYHGIVVIRRWMTEPVMGCMTKLTGALAGNYRITFNIYPVMVQKAEKEAEKEAERLAQDSRMSKRDALQVKSEQRKVRARELASGKYKAFKVLPVIRVWARTTDELRAQLGLLKNALASMSGVNYYQIDHGEQFRQLYAETLPGYLEGKYRHYDIFAKSDFLPTVLPISASFQGAGPSPDALFFGDQGNLVGFRAFADNGTPLQTTILAMRGAGKSTTLVSLISQIAKFCGFGVFIEEGQGFTVLTKLLGGESWVVSPNGRDTLNFLDTFGQPLTAVHLAGVTAMALVMTGGSSNEEKLTMRQSMLREYARQLYLDTWTGICRRDPARQDLARRLAWVIEKRSDLFEGDSVSVEERYADWRVLARDKADIAERALKEIPSEELLGWTKSPNGARAVSEMGLSLLERNEMPTLTGLVEMMRTGRRPDHSVDEVRYLVAGLEEWTKQGSNGVLFDGHSNKNLNTPFLHVDFGKIPEGSERLKEAIAFNVCNFARQKFVSLPRGMKKIWALDDPRRYIRSPIMARNVGEGFSLLRKYSVWVALATQQFDQLKDTPVWKEIVGNTAQYLLMRMESQSDLVDLAREIRLPDAAQSMVMKYVLPENQRGEGLKYSDACYFLKTAEGSIAGTLRNYASPELLWVAASSGDSFDKRKKQMAAFEEPFDAVMDATGQRKNLCVA